MIFELESKYSHLLTLKYEVKQGSGLEHESRGECMRQGAR